MKNNRSISEANIFAKAALLFCVAYYLFFALRKLSSPGIYYDEITFVNAALNIDGQFLYKRIAGIPVAIMPYIGALKSYLYYPVFKFFGVTSETLRMPVVFVSILPLILTYFTIKRVFNAWAAIAACLLIATDPAYIYYTRLDYGPVVIMMVFKMLALYCYFRFLDERRTVFLWLALASLCLGLYDKLNFIWFVLSFGFAGLTVHGRELYAIFNEKRLSFAIPVVSFIIFFVWVVFYFVLPIMKAGVGHEPMSPSKRLEFIPLLYMATMDGRAFFTFITETFLKYSSIVNIFILPALVVQAVMMTKKTTPESAEKQGARKASSFFFVIFVTVFIQILATQDARGGHHIMMLYPFHHLCLVSAMVLLCSAARQRIRRPVIAISSLIIIITVISQTGVNNEYRNAFEHGSSFSKKWSPEIYRLSDYIDSLDVDCVISADWGTFTQLFALTSKDRNRVIDLWPEFRNYSTASSGHRKYLYDSYFSGKKAAVVVHSEQMEEMPGNRANFLDFAEKFSIGLSPFTIIKTKDGVALYEVYITESADR